MNSFFDLESKLFYHGNRIADLILLNILTLVCCIPIITIGASCSALYYAVFKIYLDDESKAINNFFIAFRSNFKQASTIWCIYLTLGVILGACYYTVANDIVEINMFFRYGLFLLTIFMLFSLCWVFIFLSRYDNTLIETIRNAFIIGMTHWIETIVMCFMMLLPICLCAIFPPFIGFWSLIGVTAPCYFQAHIYGKIFEKCESDCSNETKDR